jgi:putative flippase GtrA
MRTFARFGFVGLVNTVAYFSVFLALAGWTPYLVAHSAGLVTSTVVAFTLHSLFTFRVSPTWRKAALFPLATGTTVAAHTLGLVVLVEAVRMPKAAASLSAAVAAVPITFVVSRRLLVGRSSRCPATTRSTS